MEQAPQGSGHSNESARVQAAFGQRSQKNGLIFGWSCMEPGVAGHNDSCGPLPTQDILRFYELAHEVLLKKPGGTVNMV